MIKYIRAIHWEHYEDAASGTPCRSITQWYDHEPSMCLEADGHLRQDMVEYLQELTSEQTGEGEAWELRAVLRDGTTVPYMVTP